MIAGVAVAVWTWRAVDADGYTGLPVNVLGQMAGDLLMAAIAAPALRRRTARDHARPLRSGELITYAGQAGLRIRLLDGTGLLLPPEGASRPVPGAAAQHLGELIAALGAALHRGADVEILLPAPGSAAAERAARAVNLSPGAYEALAATVRSRLATLPASTPAGGTIKARGYSEHPQLAVFACDERVWISPQSLDPLRSGNPFFALATCSRFARHTLDVFNDVFVSARPLTLPSPPDARCDGWHGVAHSRERAA
jgi:hypothetical protein